MTPPATDPKRLYLRASIKLLVAIGFLFLLVPFCSSVFRTPSDVPVDGVLLRPIDLGEGHTTRLALADDSEVFVTRTSSALRQQLKAMPADALWYGTPPGLLDAPWWVLASTSAAGEPVQFLEAQGNWPGGFIAPSGSAWDVAGRALKPGPTHPTGHIGKAQNLPAMPFRRHDDGILLLPLPAPTPAAEEPSE